MLEFKTTKKFDKQYEQMCRRGADTSKLDKVIQTLLNEQPLEPKHADHPLKGNWIGHRECHVESDWLLIYKIDKGNLILTAVRTGTHSDLF